MLFFMRLVCLLICNTLIHGSDWVHMLTLFIAIVYNAIQLLLQVSETEVETRQECFPSNAIMTRDLIMLNMMSYAVIAYGLKSKLPRRQQLCQQDSMIYIYYICYSSIEC